MTLGLQAEEVAAQYLLQHGLKLVTRNFRCRFGEIDLIVQDGKTLVFVEVRMRSSSNFGGAAASIDLRKQTKLIRTAQHYLAALTHIPPCRFDAILISSLDQQLHPATPAKPSSVLHKPDIEWVKNAFEA